MTNEKRNQFVTASNSKISTIKTHNPTQIDNHEKVLRYHEISSKNFKEYLTEVESNKQNPYLEKSKYLRKFYHFGLLAQIDCRTTYNDLQRLLKNEFRTFVIQMKSNSKTHIEKTITNLNAAIKHYRSEYTFQSPIGLAIEIHSDALCIGRIRNDQNIELITGKLIVLTACEKYCKGSLPECLYVFNLWRYLNLLEVGNKIFINSKKVVCNIVKKVHKFITVCIIKGGTVKSFMNVEIPYYIECYEPNDRDIEDLSFAMKNKADFIILPSVKSYNFLKSFKYYYRQKFCREFNIIGKLDCNFLWHKTCEMYGIIKECKAIWIDKIFKKAGNSFVVNQTNYRIIKIAQELEKPIIVTVPIKSRNDFYQFENHLIWNEFDALLIEKSVITETFPIISKNILRLPKKLLKEEIDSFPESLNIMSTANSDKNTLIRCIYSLINSKLCSGIILSTKYNSNTIIKLGSKRIYCPVIAVIKNESLGKLLNLRRNLKTIIFTTDIDEKAIQNGLVFGKKKHIFGMGDFVITLFEFGLNSKICTKLQTFYLPVEQVFMQQNGI